MSQNRMDLSQEGGLEVEKVLRRALAEERCPEDRVHCGNNKEHQKGVANWENKTEIR